jgi:hypothetical protein
MTWDATKISTFLLDTKELTVMLAISISRRLDLGQPIDGFLDDFYLICNIAFAIEEGSSEFIDSDIDSLYSMYSKIYTTHNRYKGLRIPAHHDSH